MGQSGQVGPDTGVETPGRSQKAPSQPPPSLLALGAGVLGLIWGDTNSASMDACLHCPVKQDISISRAMAHMGQPTVVFLLAHCVPIYHREQAELSAPPSLLQLKGH